MHISPETLALASRAAEFYTAGRVIEVDRYTTCSFVVLWVRCFGAPAVEFYALASIEDIDAAFRANIADFAASVGRWRLDLLGLNDEQRGVARALVRMGESEIRP